MKTALDPAEMERQLAMVASLVAQPVPESDPAPCLVGHALYVGNKHHVADVDLLMRLGVTGVLNCASSGIRNLPIGRYKENGIQYAFTNAQDDTNYPILHRPEGTHSEHLLTAKAFYDRVRNTGGTCLFFCVAGQNRSATLAVAVQLLGGHALRAVLNVCRQVRCSAFDPLSQTHAWSVQQDDAACLCDADGRCGLSSSKTSASNDSSLSSRPRPRTSRSRRPPMPRGMPARRAAVRQAALRQVARRASGRGCARAVHTPTTTSPHRAPLWAPTRCLSSCWCPASVCAAAGIVLLLSNALLRLRLLQPDARLLCCRHSTRADPNSLMVLMLLLLLMMMMMLWRRHS